MHQVVADSVSPVDGAVESAVGVVLVEQMGAALPLDQAVGVVEPMSRRQEMILGTMGVIGEGAAQGTRFVEFELKGVCFHRSHLPLPTP